MRISLDLNGKPHLIATSFFSFAIIPNRIQAHTHIHTAVTARRIEIKLLPAKNIHEPAIPKRMNKVNYVNALSHQNTIVNEHIKKNIFLWFRSSVLDFKHTIGNCIFGTVFTLHITYTIIIRLALLVGLISILAILHVE